MLVLVGNHSNSQVNFISGTREINISNWKYKFNHGNIITISVNSGGLGNSSFKLAESGRWFCEIFQVNSTAYKIIYYEPFPSLNDDDDIQIIVDINEALDISITDQPSPIISMYAINVLDNPTLASNTIINSNQITLSSGHNCVVGNYLNFYGDKRFNQSKVIAVNDNTITLNSPMDVQFTINDIVERGTIDMSVNGSITNKIYIAKPTISTDWHICEIVFYIEDDATMDGGKFGGIPALSKGVAIRKKNSVIDNLFEFSSNGDLDVIGNLKYDDRAGGTGVYSLVTKINLNDRSKYGVVVELLSADNDHFEILIQDDLTGLTNFYCHIHGHVVEY